MKETLDGGGKPGIMNEDEA